MMWIEIQNPANISIVRYYHQQPPTEFCPISMPELRECQKQKKDKNGKLEKNKFRENEKN